MPIDRKGCLGSVWAMVCFIARALQGMVIALVAAGSTTGFATTDPMPGSPRDPAPSNRILTPAGPLFAAGKRPQPQDSPTQTQPRSGPRKPSVAGRLRSSTAPSGMIEIRVAAFRMGSPTNEFGRSSNERQWTVTLTWPFRIADHEVTRGEYETVMGTSPGEAGDPGLPVVMVSWAEAQEFCTRLTVLERAAGRLPQSEVYRLPTEAEWEFAARAGTVEARYGDLDEIAWWAGNAGAEVQLPKGRLQNDLQLFDMIGNVSEWCLDRYGDYPEASGKDPTGAKTGSSRVVRGGSWSDGEGSNRSAWRGKEFPESRLPTVGFRIVRGRPVSP